MHRLGLLALATSLALACTKNSVDVEDDDAGDGSEAPGDGDGDGDGDGNDDDGGSGATAGDGATGSLDVGDEVGDSGGDDDGGSTDSAMPAVIEGEFLLALSTIVNPDLPLQFSARVQVVGDGEIAIAMQPLSLDQGSQDTPREPVGDPLSFPSIPLTPDGGFTLSVGTVMIPGVANPITGSDIVADVTLVAADGVQPFCGQVTGTITQPLMLLLDGSTFAMTPLRDGAWPDPFAWACP